MLLLRRSLAAGDIYVGPVSIENNVRQILSLKSDDDKTTIPLLFPLNDDAEAAMFSCQLSSLAGLTVALSSITRR